MTFHLHCLVFTFLVFHFLITAFTPTMFFVFIRVLHSLKTVMAPAEFCICPWLALPEKCVDSCSVLYLSVAYTPKTICWFMKCFVYISMACNLQILCWFLQCFVFIHGLHFPNTVLIPTAFCIYSWPAFCLHCANFYSILHLSMTCIPQTACWFLQHFAFILCPQPMLIPTVFYIYPWPAPGERWSQVPELSVQHLGQWKTLLLATSEKEMRTIQPEVHEHTLAQLVTPQL